MEVPLALNTLGQKESLNISLLLRYLAKPFGEPSLTWPVVLSDAGGERHTSGCGTEGELLLAFLCATVEMLQFSIWACKRPHQAPRPFRVCRNSFPWWHGFPSSLALAVLDYLIEVDKRATSGVSGRLARHSSIFDTKRQ